MQLPGREGVVHYRPLFVDGEIGDGRTVEVGEMGEPKVGRDRRRVMRGCTFLLAVPLAILAEVVAAIRLRQKRERRGWGRPGSGALNPRQKEPNHERA